MRARVLLGVVAVMGVALAAVFIFYASGSFVDKQAIAFFHNAWVDMCVFGLLALGCLSASWALIMLRRWAWWVAGAGSLAICSIALLCLLWSLFPRDEFAQREMGGYGFFLAQVLGAPSMLAIILLMLPEVRRAVFGKSAH